MPQTHVPRRVPFTIVLSKQADISVIRGRIKQLSPGAIVLGGRSYRANGDAVIRGSVDIADFERLFGAKPIYRKVVIDKRDTGTLYSHTWETDRPMTVPPTLRGHIDAVEVNLN